MFVTVNSDYLLNIISQFTLVMVTACALFEVRTEFLSIIYTSFGFRGLEYL
jgi:hypothetical protein